MKENIEELLEDEIKVGNGVSKDDGEYGLMFKELSKVEGFKEYLMKTLARDMKRYFLSTKETQDLTRGAYLRTEYLYNKLIQNS